MKINAYMTIFGDTGYDMHCKGLLDGLNKAGHDINLETQLPPNWQMLVNDFQLKTINKKFDPEGVTIAVATPLYWQYFLSAKPKHFIGFLVWEGDKIPASWLNNISDERVDQIWVPSQHTKDAIFKTIDEASEEVLRDGHSGYPDVMKKIKIVPHGHFPELFGVLDEKEMADFPFYDKDMFTFVGNKGWAKPLTDRGGVQYLLEAFSKEFKQAEKVRLLLKLNISYNPEMQVGQFLEALPLKAENKANISIIHNQVLPEELTKIYNCGDVFVSTPMAEAFNLPGIEAMACGLPNIQTHFGGQNEYMTSNNGFLIDEGEMCLVEDDLLYEGISWFKPNIKAIQEKLRKVYQLFIDDKDVYDVMSNGALKTAKKFTWEETGKIATKFLEELK